MRFQKFLTNKKALQMSLKQEQKSFQYRVKKEQELTKYIKMYEKLIILCFYTISNNNLIVSIQQIQQNLMTTEGQKIYTWADVGKHNSDKDIWVVIGDYVYDLTNYSSQHPGGPIVLQNKAGRNATTAFDQASHSQNARNQIMPKFRIGKIDKQSPIEQWQKEPLSSSPNILLTVGIIAVILAIIYFLAA